MKYAVVTKAFITKIWWQLYKTSQWRNTVTSKLPQFSEGLCTSINMLTQHVFCIYRGYQHGIRFQLSNQLGFQVDIPGNFLSKCQMYLGVKGNTNRVGESVSRKLSSRLQLCCFPPAHPQDSPSFAQFQAEGPEMVIVHCWLLMGGKMETKLNLQQVGLCEMQRSLKCRRSFSSSRTWKIFNPMFGNNKLF